MRSRAALSLFLAAATFSAATAATDLVLKQVHVVTRHGSRLALRKSDTLKEFTEGPLTALGQLQMYNLGVWIKARYNHRNASFFFDAYAPDKVRLESSAFERTISSANALALGLFNASARDPLQESMLPSSIHIIPANIPVYSRDVANDYMIRAYDKCPDGLRLDDLYESVPFQALAQRHAQLLETLGAMPTFSAFTDAATDGAIALDIVWNVYDSIQVAKTECGASTSSSTCTPERKQLVHLLTPAQWKELQQVAKQAEFLKYGTKNAGRLIGGNLMLEILQRMQDDTMTTTTAAAAAAVGLDGFYLYSAHYPVLLGLLAALEEDPVNKESIPAYAAAILLELYVDTTTMEKLVRVLYRPGSNEHGADEAVTTVVLDSVCAAANDDDDDDDDDAAMCSLASLTEYFADFSLQSWCQECGSPADVCLQCKPLATCNDVDSDSDRVAGFFMGLVVAFVAVACSFLLVRRRRTSCDTDKQALDATTSFSAAPLATTEISDDASMSPAPIA